MIVYADNTAFAADLLGEPTSAWTTHQPSLDAELVPLATQLYGEHPWSRSVVPGPGTWSHVFAVETAGRSQFDVLVHASKTTSALPSGIACLAGSGRGFHGFRDRPWMALAGNIHLSAHLTMPRGTAMSIAEVIALAAVSVVETIDGIPGLAGRAGIKWVNDILIDEAKVSGILAHLEHGDRGMTSTVIGIGLNVEARPDVLPTPFVPRVGALRDFAEHPGHCDRRTVLAALLTSLDRNYRSLVDRGPSSLRERYRQRSVVVGRTVAVCAEGDDPEPQVLAEGVVASVGDSLELVLQGHATPFVRGRLIVRPFGPRKSAPA